MGLPNERPFPSALLIVLVAGLFIRILFVFVHQRPVVSDERENDELAHSIVTDASYAIEGIPTAYRPVGYPAFLSIAYTAFGHHPIAAKLLQAFLDTLTAYFLFLLGNIRSQRTGEIAAALWVFFLPAILFSNLLLTESLTVFLVVLSFLVFQRLQPSTSSIFFAVCGFLVGAAILVKPALLPFPFLLLVFARKMSLPARQMIVLAAATLAVILPWMTRNLLVLDTFTLSTNGGMNLYVGNNPSATGAYSGVFPEELSDSTIDEITRNQRAMKLATDYVTSSPRMFFLNGVKKVAHVFRSEGDILIGSFADSISFRKVGFKKQYRSVPISVAVATNLSSFLLLLLGIAGFLASERNRLFWFSAVFVISSLLVHFVFFGGSRFHFPFMPFATLYAAFAATSFLDRRFVLSRTGTLSLLACAVVLSTLWTYELILIYHSG